MAAIAAVTIKDLRIKLPPGGDRRWRFVRSGGG
jgi:hypothetical protein